MPLTVHTLIFLSFIVMHLQLSFKKKKKSELVHFNNVKGIKCNEPQTTSAKGQSCCCSKREDRGDN